MVRDGINLLSWVEFESLADFLVISPVPVRESALKQDKLFNAFLLRVVDEFDALEVATVLRLKLLLD